MPLTKEELLKPRYKCIADYPQHPFSKGSDHTFIEGDLLIPCNVNGVPTFKRTGRLGHMSVGVPCCAHPEYWPKIFQPLPWWSDRKIEDMPEYVRYSTYYLNHYHLFGYPQYENKIFKIDKWENGHYGAKAIGEGIIHPYEINFYPADEEEYTAYINQKQQ